MNTRIIKNKKCNITNNYSNNHLAVDIVGTNSTLDYVLAHTKGRIVFCQDGYENMKGSTGNASYGNFVKIDHGNGYCTLYAHMKKKLPVKHGQIVEKGEILGYMSDSGNAYGSHLHFEVWKDNQRINPTEYLDKDLFNVNPLDNKTNEELAKEVIQGKYGNGLERKNKLGNRYAKVQDLVNKILNTEANYLKNSTYKGVSIVDALKEINVDSSFSYRFYLANLNGITNYTGTSEQNTYMLKLLNHGNLRMK